MSLLPRCTCHPFKAVIGVYDPRCVRHSVALKMGPVAARPLTTTPVASQKTSDLTGNQGDSVEFDRDTDGELLIDWSPNSDRMLSLSLRGDGRLSYAFRWDGEVAHGTAQMPPATTPATPAIRSLPDPD